jgi:septal ring factor EnvC (AmiA/AmiB activator)
MRPARLFTALLAFTLLASSLADGGPQAGAQTTDQAEEAATEARQRADVASGMVDEAVANRDSIERQLAESIARMNDLTAELSIVGSSLDRLAIQVGYADVELAGIQADIEDQAVDAYMTVLASPSFSVVTSSSVEEAMVANSMVEDVVEDGRLTVDKLFAKRRGLVTLQETYLLQQEEYQNLQARVDEEIAKYTALYEEADAEIAAAIREADEADRAYRSALSAVDLAQAKEAERQRQENRSDTTTSTTSPPNPTSTTAPSTTSTTSDEGGGGPWNHPPQVERWRSLVQQFFPSTRVEEALAIIDCESHGDPDAVNPYSGASGLFQFLPSTWATTAPNAGYSGYSVFDPEANIAVAAWLANRYQQLGYPYWTAWSCRRVLG